MMAVACLRSDTSISRSMSKKSCCRCCRARLRMLPPASPITVATWPSTPGALRMVARRRVRASAPSSASAVHCRSCQTESSSATSASRWQSMVCTVRPAPSSRMPTMRSPGRGEQQAPKWIDTPGVRPPPRMNSRAASSTMRRRSGAALVTVPFNCGNRVSITRAGATWPRPMASNSSSSPAMARVSSAGLSATSASALSTRARVCSSATLPSFWNSERSEVRM